MIAEAEGVLRSWAMGITHTPMRIDSSTDHSQSAGSHGKYMRTGRALPAGHNKGPGRKDRRGDAK